MTEDLSALQAENERLRAALSAADSRIELVLEATNDGVWDWNPSTDEASFSRRSKAILGYEEHEVEDTGAAFFALLHEQDKAKVEAAVTAHLEQRAPYIIDFRMRA